MERVRKHFQPEFLNRIDEFICFEPLRYSRSATYSALYLQPWTFHDSWAQHSSLWCSQLWPPLSNTKLHSMVSAFNWHAVHLERL
jgi:hypothetical protein